MPKHSRETPDEPIEMSKLTPDNKIKHAHLGERVEDNRKEKPETEIRGENWNLDKEERRGDKIDRDIACRMWCCSALVLSLGPCLNFRSVGDAVMLWCDAEKRGVAKNTHRSG
jgi:hypothetical protein